MPEPNSRRHFTGQGIKLKSWWGGGGFGEVYLATHLQQQLPRALKVLRRDALGMGETLYKEIRLRFLIEAQIGAKLDHPNIVKATDFGQGWRHIYPGIGICRGRQPRKRS